MPFYLLVLVVASAYIICRRISTYWTALKFRRAHGCKPVTGRHPTTAKGLFIGLDLVFECIQAAKNHTYLEATRARFRKYGTTWTTQVFANTIIQTIEPENLKAVYATRFQDYCLGDYRTDSFKPVLGNSIFTLDLPAWKHSRDMLRPAFMKNQFTKLHVYERHIGHLVNCLPRDGVTPVDLQPLFFKYTLDSATDILFGHSIHSLLGGVDRTAEKFADAYEKVKGEVFKNFQLHPLGKLRDLREMNEAIKIIHDYVDHFVEMAMAKHDISPDDSSESFSFMRDIIRGSNDKEKVRSEILSLLLAGRDTTAALLSNVFFVLARRPDVLEKMQSEIRPLAGRAPTYDELKQLRYVHWVLNESLRLHTVVPVNTRTATRNTVLPRGGGPAGLSPVFVPAGAQVVTNVYALHRRPDIYGPDADRFRPERWGADAAPRPHWSFVPFSGGPRVCPGMGLAMAETAYTTVRLLQMFGAVKAVRSGEGKGEGEGEGEGEEEEEEWTEDLAITCANLRGARVVLVPV